MTEAHEAVGICNCLVQNVRFFSRIIQSNKKKYVGFNTDGGGNKINLLINPHFHKRDKWLPPGDQG